MVTSIGMMDAAYLVGRTEILAWINSTLHLNQSKVEETDDEDPEAIFTDLIISLPDLVA
ncbi:hypothetical protein Syun_023395 [Stephania yunnanensis]|uniref:Uncharacterized protein n=1 Tax=Stephania yunnanensis TaxID=152371 RepID=A0AAP0I3S4_9MAGN